MRDEKNVKSQASAGSRPASVNPPVGLLSPPAEAPVCPKKQSSVAVTGNPAASPAGFSLPACDGCPTTKKASFTVTVTPGTTTPPLSTTTAAPGDGPPLSHATWFHPGSGVVRLTEPELNSSVFAPAGDGEAGPAEEA